MIFVARGKIVQDKEQQIAVKFNILTKINITKNWKNSSLAISSKLLTLFLAPSLRKSILTKIIRTYCK